MRERLSILASWPPLAWGSSYTRATLSSDLTAALIVTIMLIPQSLAYAMLAGLPPQAGLYASILPLVTYALFGSSRVLAVGPVAVVSLMTAAAIGKIAPAGSSEAIAAALALALISGLMLLALGILRLGFLANFLSHPVISGFITASGILIAAGQLKHVFGVSASGHTVQEIAISLWENASAANLATVVIGLGSAAFLFWSRRKLKPLLVSSGIGARWADVLAKASPVAAVAVTTIAAWTLDLGSAGVRLVGAVPQGLPPLTVPPIDTEMWLSLAGSATLITIVGFVESVSVAQTLAAKRRQRIVPDQELIGLGSANVAAAFSGGYPVTGGFARSVVNFDAGAETPAAGIFTAVGIAIATLTLTPLLAYLPQATLGATIIVAVLSLVDFGIFKRSWRYAKADFAAVLATMSVTLFVSVELGILAGVLLSLLIHLYRTSRPHVAVVGQVAGTEHFRNVLRHEVITNPAILSVRVDESLYFANARFLEDFLFSAVAQKPDVKHVILVCPAVNAIDLSALESLENINRSLAESGVTLNLSEVKGPVMDRLKRSDFLEHLTGRVFLSQHLAVQELAAGINKAGASEKA
ncbi:sulfate permease [Mesorhizobium sp. Z1-4]|uniref:SulP family inorganic anion transporter n=1 Tax=Mesorhizobium sp. Z1-4 TaxID=2448478 RepID=UPI000FDC72B4|nr:sulfate permease [Mesorhizobium sp. Z1-4]